MKALIDHDLVVFRCAASAENDSLNIAIHRVEALLDELLTKTGADSYRAFLSGKSNFRKTIYPEYKANRTAPKPIHLEALREYALEKQNAELAPDTLEADDALGINQTDDTMIVSLDKDLLMVPGKHFSWEINGKGWSKPDKFFTQDVIGGMRLFFEQCLKGDTADNIKGIEKIGNKRAKALLADCVTEQEMFDTVRDAYSNDEEFIMNASVLWIMQHEEDIWKNRFNAYVQK
ncbi:exonuclease [Methylophilales phage MEP401]|jgi:5'-3' exonuclease|nr:exonuclease [Methylophilales phage MEP401]